MKNQVEEKKNNVEAEKPIALPSNLERTTSIDNEPKTLLQEELDLAREEALRVINTHSKEEALKIFLNGLQPVTSAKQQPSQNNVVYDDDSEDDFMYDDSDDDYVLSDEEDEDDDDDE